MRQTKFVLAFAAAAALAACGGGSSTGGDQTLKTKYSALVSFGDSLSDVGTYAVGGVAALGGGKYTINGDGTATNPALTGKNWTEVLSTQLGLPAPCAAQTGLVGDASLGFSVPVTNHSGCYGYAQGGARVSNPVGPGNIATGASIGQMTVPVSQQIANHLAAAGGHFSGTELVDITVGGNDVSMQLAMLQAAATAAGTAAGTTAGQTAFVTELVGLFAAQTPNPAAAGPAIGAAFQQGATAAAQAGATGDNITLAGVSAAIHAAIVAGAPLTLATPEVYGPIVAKAKSDAATAGAAAGATAGAAYFKAHAAEAVQGMAQAASDLVALVKTQILAKGANTVVVNNLGDFANAPVGKSLPSDVQALVAAMVDAFNGTLKAGLAAEPKVLLVDLYSISHDEIVNPGPYGLSNTSDPACPTTLLANSALGCTTQLATGNDAAHYMFADDRHPTPYEYRLIAQYVAEQMILKGWL